MPGHRPVAQSTVVHVLLIDTFTHCGFYPTGQTTGLCEYAYGFLCSITLSGDNRNLTVGRNPGRVNGALGVAITRHSAKAQATCISVSNVTRQHTFLPFDTSER
jgi:hypothetical protein